MTHREMIQFLRNEAQSEQDSIDFMQLQAKSYDPSWRTQRKINFLQAALALEEAYMRPHYVS